MASRHFTFALVLTGTSLIAACSDSGDSRPQQPPTDAVGFSATVHRTEGGLPHIVANDWGSLGFGSGYAAAEDNVCILAENILRLRGQLSEYLGPQDGNLNSDLFRAYMVQSGIYDADVSTEMEYMYTGFAAGFNQYLLETGVDNIPDPACRGASWIQQMSANDVRRAELTPAFLPRLATLFLAAKPPATVAKANSPERDLKRQKSTTIATTAAAPVLPTMGETETQQLAAVIEDMATARDKGSNGVAIGRDLSNHSGGLLYTNPHLGWDVSFRFYPRHQIIPGVINLLGANIYERALVGFGTNGEVAWTNTVTASRTQALYELELVPGNPLAYRFDGQDEEMQQITVTVNVLGADGNLTEQSHTLYETRHGLVLGQIFTWDTTTAFALRIADEGNRGQNGQAIALARSKTVHDVKAALSQYQASPSTNIVAADSSGEAFYGDMGPVANMTNEQLQDCATATPVLISFFAPAFRGDTSECEWQTDEDSAAEGLLGASQQASLIRSDYVTNSNDSYWLANPNAPIANIPHVQGNIEDERTVRTRSGLRMIQQRIDGSDNLGGNTFDIDSLIERMLSNQNHAGQLLRDDLVTLCENNPDVLLGDSSVNISPACPVLDNWDLHSNLDSRGAHLFREFIRAGNNGSASSRTLPESFNYDVPFDLEDPVNTPSGLNTSDNPAALEALATAVTVLGKAGIALDARLGDLQSVTRNEQVIPMHGGEESEGVFNKMSLGFAESDGYPEVSNSSATWIMAVEFTPSGPLAKGILAYSISANTESPHYADMTELYSNKTLVDLPYELVDVEAAAVRTTELSAGTTTCENGGWSTFQQPQFADETACKDYYIDIQANQLLDFAED